MRENQDYYDEFAGWYERHRGGGYHALIDDLEAEVVLDYGHKKSVLEAGCGTGLVLERIKGFAEQAIGVDLSMGMITHAQRRGLTVAQANLCQLPFSDNTFDVVCSFKVLAHVEAITTAVAELARVTRPKGHLVLEFYNQRSLRYLIKRLKPGTPISDRETDEAVFTRYDTLDTIRSYLPPSVELVGYRGVRVVTPFAAVHQIAPLSRILGRLERRSRDLPVLAQYGGFLIVIARKVSS